MRLYKRVFCVCMVVLGLLLDTSVMPFSGANIAYMPKFALLSIITIALLMGRTQGILYGMIGGVVMDITLTIPTGLVAVMYTIAGFLAGWIGRGMRVRILSSIIAPIAAMLLYELSLALLFVVNSQTLSGAMLVNALIRTFIGTAIIQILYLLFNAVLKPKHSRYSGR